MNDERAFAALLMLYPRTFRQEYGADMLETFRALRADRRSRLAFWLFVCSDVVRSACHEQMAACRSGTRQFVGHWVAICVLGVGVTAILVNLVGWTFSYFYHPYLEGWSFTPWTYGALLGGGLGVAQRAALGRRARIGISWIPVSAISAAIGLNLAMMAASPVVFGAVLGAIVGSGQWLLLRPRTKRARSWIVATAVALPIGVLLRATAMHRTLAGMNPVASVMASSRDGSPLDGLIGMLYAPRSWPELFAELALVATAGLIVGTVTARSVSAAGMTRNSRQC